MLLVALAAACSRTPEPPESLFASAQEDVRRGAIAAALSRIEAGEALGPANAAWWWKFRLLRAEALLLRREKPAAVEILTALDPADVPAPDLLARRSYLQAFAELTAGKVQDAGRLLETARTQIESAPLVKSGATEETAFDIDVLRSQVLLRGREWEKAERLLLDVDRRAAARPSAYHQAVALNMLGNSRIGRNRFGEALAYFERVLALDHARPYTVYGGALANAGVSYARLGQFDRAVEVQQRAVASHEARDVPTYLGLALGELGNTYVLQNDYRRGLEYLSRAFDVAMAAGTPDAAVWGGNRAKVAIDLRDFDRAETFNAEAVRLKERTKASTLYNTLYSAQIALGRRQYPEARRLFDLVLVEAASDPGARWEAFGGLARTALEAGDRAVAARHFEAAIDTIHKARVEVLRTEYRLTFLARVTRLYQDYVEMLMASGHPSRALEVADASRAVVLAERMGGTGVQRGTAARFVAAAARSRTVWLSYWLAPRRSYAWVVTPAGIHVAELAGAEQIASIVEQYRALVEKTSFDPLESAGVGDALYAAVLGSVARFIPAGSAVRIVPDGPLHGVNFETIPVDGPRRRYWIEDVTLAVAPSLGLLSSAATDHVPAGPRSLLLVGNPTPREKEFPRLGYAAVEMQAVAGRFPGRTTTYDGDAASPDRFMGSRLDEFSVIHFTAHAAANRTSPLDSAVILSGPPGTDRLYARDVAERALRAELVTISACRSAGERAYTGEGLIGFSWAFLRAGARQVVAGLWDVDDRSTAALMDALYGRFSTGTPVPEALRAAKLEMIGKGGSSGRPYYWGPFEVFTVSPR